jgi:transcriptional regulator with XRE-family HTH domain
MIRLKLKEVLEEKGVGMGKLSRLSDISYSTIFRICTDPTYSPSLNTLGRLAKALAVPLSALYEELPDES